MADGIDRFFDAVSRGFEAAGDATVKGMEAVGITHPQPGPEPEVNIDWSKVRQDGKKFFVTDAKGKEIEYSVTGFNKLICKMNISILTARITVFKGAKGIYEAEMTKVRSLLRERIRVSVDDTRDRDKLKNEIDDLWQEYQDRFKHTKHTPEAQRFIDEKISPKQKLIASAIPAIDEYLEIKANKYFYDLRDIKDVADWRAKGDKVTKVKLKMEVFEGHGEELIDFYQGKIDEIDSDDDFKSFQERLDANNEWLNQ